jgi:hypothetical protein
MTFIEDPSSGRRARVDVKKRLDVHATTRSEELDASLDENSFNVNTGMISLATGEHGVIYLKNNNSAPVSGTVPVLVIRTMVFFVGIPSAGFTATGEPTCTVIRNPTAGTVVSDANAAPMKSNNNFGSSLPFTDTLAYSASASGKTITDGTDHAFFGTTGSGRVPLPTPWVLPFGSSVGVKIDANISSGTCNVYCALVCFYEAADV